MRVQASFRGAPFHVEGESQTGGRRGPRWEFPGRDTPSGQDTGRRARKFSIRAYVNGTTLDQDRDALLTALEAHGPGLLVHPVLGSLQVFVDEYTRTEDIGDDISATFEISFSESGDEPAPRTLADPTGALSTAADSLLTDIAAAYSAAVRYAGQVDAVQGSLIATLRAQAADIRAFTVNNPVARQIARVSELAEALDEIDQSIEDLAASPATWAASLQNALALIASTAAFRLLTGDAGTATPALTGSPAPSQETTRANGEAARQLYVDSALAYYAASLSVELAAESHTRASGQAELDTITTRIDSELDIAGTPQTLYDVRAAVQAETSARLARLPDVTTITIGEPSSWLAESWRLYGSTSQAEDLWRSNGRGDPSIVVGDVEVYAA